MSLDALGPRLRAGRHYRPRQLAAYVWDRGVRLLESASPVDPRRATRLLSPRYDPDRGVLASWGGRPGAIALAPSWRPEVHGDPRQGVYRFQEVEAVFGDRVDWEAPAQSKLWRFHLHYFDGAAALAASDPEGDWQGWLAAVLEDHWERCRPGQGYGWQAFPLACRQANLLRIWAVLESVGGIDPALLKQLARHTRVGFHYLRLRLEQHLQGNHLLKELAVLVTSAQVWAEPALRRHLTQRLRREIEVQFLAGGGHEERSLRYHLDCLRDLAEVRAALGSETPSWLDRATRRGLDFAAALEHPDGQVPLFNDAELGMAHPRASLSELVGHVAPGGEGLRRFDAEGYVVARSARSHLVVDCGPVAPDHQPAHSHCDILSFELSIDGQRIVGNRGTLAYGGGPDRALSRTTASHNTLQIGDHEQVEVWSAFRLGWRRAPEIVVAQDGPPPRIEGRFLWHPDVGAEHRRTFRLTDAAALRVDDEVRFSKGPQPVAARLHLPDAELVEASADQVLARTGGVTVRIGVEGAALEAEPCDWFPRMGVRRPGLRVVVRPPAGGAELRFTTTVEAVSA
ncbi:MAG: hypothetical protein GY898_15335 [Proteobacteria bacterium]|nr:hypothetical protein [Pseudomonadota bacterium]